MHPNDGNRSSQAKNPIFLLLLAMFSIFQSLKCHKTGSISTFLQCPTAGKGYNILCFLN
jgi:hypothetical protein